MSHVDRPRVPARFTHRRVSGWLLRPLSAAAGVLLALTTLPLSSPVAAGAGGAERGPVVATDTGKLRGATKGSVDSFLGIPYAAPPVGTLRWAPPRPAPSWTGVRPALAYGSTCPAAASSNGPRSEDEDCLFANVQRPAGTRTGDKLPVYVFIHGGGLQNGSSNQADGAAIVRSSDVVVVSFNYRLGVFGFLAHPALTKRQGESGNYGVMDQQAALRWVQRNIASFGGDPGRVTVGGESAGGWSVCTQLVAPGSRGLIDRAIIQSASCPSTTQRAAESSGLKVARAVNCAGNGADALACLRRTVVGALLDVPSDGFPAPVRGTRFLPRDPRLAIEAGRFDRVPVLIGANRDEGRTFTTGNVGWTEQQYTAWVGQSFGDQAAAVLARYPWPKNANRFTGAYLSGAILTDSGQVAGIGGCVNRELIRDFALHTPTWAYEFAHRRGPGLTPEPAGYHWGAGHAAELAYLFPSFDNGTPIAPTFDAGERALAGQMKRAWGTFVHGERPHTWGLPNWPRFDRTDRVMSLRAGGTSTVITDRKVATQHQCDLWNGLAER